jgi:hypothetical protein
LVAFVALVIVFTLAGSTSAQGKGKGNSKGNPSRSEKVNSDKPGKPDNDKIRDFPSDNKYVPKDDDRSSNRFKGLSKKTGLSQNTLQTRYEIERRLNPDLTYGQFVAAHMIAKNHKGISTGDILGGLRDGKSIGQTLKDRRWDKKRIDRERKRVRDIFKGDDEYHDRDLDWLF